MELEPVIGLEIHAQLLTKSKIFCGCSTTFGASPNTHTCPVCLGMPGVLPVLNREVVEFAMKMALATHCTIAPTASSPAKTTSIPTFPRATRFPSMNCPWPGTAGWT